MSTSPDAPAAPSRLGLGTVVALVALIAAGLGWRLAWAQGQEQLRAPLDLRAGEVDELARELAAKGGHEAAREAVRRMKENDGVRGVDLLALLDHAATSGRIGSGEDTESRAWTAARLAGHALVWVPWVLLVVVLLHGRRPLGSIARGLLIAHGAIVLSGLGLIALGASQHARDAFQANPTIVGPGLYALLGGGVLGLLVGLFGGRRGGFFRALGLAVLLLAAAVGALVVHLRP